MNVKISSSERTSVNKVNECAKYMSRRNMSRQSSPTAGPPPPPPPCVPLQPQWETSSASAPVIVEAPSASSFDQCVGSGPPVSWTRVEDDRLRFLRSYLEQNQQLPPNSQQEFLELERKSALFEREGMLRLMHGRTPEQAAAAEAQFSSSSASSPSSFLGSIWNATTSAASKAGDYLGRKVPELNAKMPEAGKAAWFYTSLISTGAPALARRVGLLDEDSYQHYNWIELPDAARRMGGFALGAVPIISPESMGGQMEKLRVDCKEKGTTLGCYVACLTPEEMDGYGIHAIRFAKPADWKNMFGADFEVIDCSCADCTAAGFSYEKIMAVCTRINEYTCNGKSVFCSCKAGKGRSWTVTVCFLIAFRGMSVKTAVAHVKAKRHQVSPSPTQVDFVEAFYRSFIVLEAQNRIERERMQRLRSAGCVAHERYGLIDAPTPRTSPPGAAGAAAPAASSGVTSVDNIGNADNDDDNDDSPVADNKTEALTRPALQSAQAAVADVAPAAAPTPAATAEQQDNKAAHAAMNRIFGGKDDYNEDDFDPFK